MPSFAEAATTVIEQKRVGWRDPRQALQWMASLKRYAFPSIGEMAVSDVTSADVLEILTPIWHVKPALARNLRWRIRAVLEWAVAMEFRIDNPCDRLGPVLGPQYHVSASRAGYPVTASELVGAQSLAAGGASIVEMQTAGRWQSPAMPGHYARGQLAARGAVARVRYGRG